MTKGMLVLLTLALVGLGIGACGGAAKDTSSASQLSSSSPALTAGALSKARSSGTSTGHYVKDDEDDDDEGHGPNGEDKDDYPIRGYGRPGTAADRRAVMTVVRRYFAAAAAGDGAKACALMDRHILQGSDLERAVPEEFRPVPGSPLFRGKSCTQVESLLFGVNRQQLMAEAATLRVTSVRVNGAGGLALLGFTTMGEREIRLRREHGFWGIDVLLDRPIT